MAERLQPWSRRRALAGVGALGGAGLAGGLWRGREPSAVEAEIRPPPTCAIAPPLSAPAAPPPGFLAGVSLAHAHRRGYGYGSQRCRDELARLVDLGATAVSLMPFGYLPDTAAPTVRFGGDRTLTDEDLRRAADDAHALGLAVILKPHLWGDGFWGGATGTTELDASGAEGGWAAWFEAYGAFAVHYARVAAACEAELYCVGLELTRATRDNPGAWAAVAARCRQVYTGKLTYGANWWEEAEIFQDWAAFDLIGLNAYYPLSEAPDPSLRELIAGWSEPLARICDLSARVDRPVLFTEVGCRSVRGAAAKPWDQALRGPADPELPARACEALMAALLPQPWAGGVFLWKWFSDGGLTERDDYDLRDGPAERVLARWWGGGR